jgi:hypothetical protein
MAKLIAPLPASPDNFPLLGTVSHGTMRAEDLIPAFCDALDALGRHDCASMARSAYEGAPCDADNLGYILDFLFNALDACAPRAYYFGAHPGDGSDYGFWQIEED